MDTLTVFEIMTHKTGKWFVSPPLPCLMSPLRENTPEFLDETHSAKTRRMGSENFVILFLISTILTDPRMWQTDRRADGRTDGDSIARSALCSRALINSTQSSPLEPWLDSVHEEKTIEKPSPVKTEPAAAVYKIPHLRWCSATKITLNLDFMW